MVKLTMMDFNEIFQGGLVPSWLERFSAEPVDALERLLTGAADLGSLNPEDPDLVLLNWLEYIGVQGGFAELVDASLAQWIERSWGTPILPGTGTNATRTARAWCRAASIIRMEERMTRSAELLRDLMLIDRTFLNAIHEGRPLDPQGMAWLAVARYQQDRSLLDEWWRLCSLPPDEPWYRGGYGIHGLRGLPVSHHVRGFPQEVAEGLAVLAVALDARSAEGWIDQQTARAEFIKVAHLTMAAYPFPPKWRSFWRHACGRSYDIPEDWVRNIVDLGEEGNKLKSFRRQESPWLLPDPEWIPRRQAIVKGLNQRVTAAIASADQLLHDEEAYGEVTGNFTFAVKSACNFAGRIKEYQPEIALRWLSLARRLDPWNPYGWTTAVTTLLQIDRKVDAIKMAFDAIERYPENAVAWCGLADVLKAQGELEKAAAVYRETTARFPENVVAWCGLADVLKVQGELEKAVAVYRETTVRFPYNVVARNGLADVLKAQGDLEQAAIIYRGTLQQSPSDLYAQHGLKDILKDLPPDTRKKILADELQIETTGTELGTISTVPSVVPPAVETMPEESQAELRASDKQIAQGSGAPSAVRLRSQDIEIMLTDTYLIRRWGRLTGQFETPELAQHEARRILEQMQQFIDVDPRVAGESALIRLQEGEIESTLVFLREASKRFPGSLRVRFVLARAERQLAQLCSGRDVSRHALITPWRELTRRDGHFRPLSLLGEGRGYCVLTDDTGNLDEIRNSFGQLGRWITRQIEPASDSESLRTKDYTDNLRTRFKPKDGANPFSSWWATEVQINVFGDRLIANAKEIDDPEAIRAQALDRTHLLDRIEEEYLFRYAPI